MNYEFYLLHPEAETNFLDTWPALSACIVEKAPSLTKSPSLHKFINEEAGKFAKFIRL